MSSRKKMLKERRQSDQRLKLKQQKDDLEKRARLVTGAKTARPEPSPPWMWGLTVLPPAPQKPYASADEDRERREDRR